MQLNFRQGIVSYQLPSFLTVTPGFVSLLVTNTQTLVTFAQGSNNYLLTEKISVANAWTIVPSVDQWLYWDINTVTGIRTFGVTIYTPIVSGVAPVTPAIDQHWFDTVSTTMKVWNGSAWSIKIRVFACKLVGGSGPAFSVSINAPLFNGTQVGIINVMSTSGAILFDQDNLKPLRKSDGTFLTTETTLSLQSGAAASVKLAGVVVPATAEQTLSAFTVVRFSNFGQIVAADIFTSESIPFGMIQTPASLGQDTLVTISGVVSNIDWNWPTINQFLYSDSNGQLTTVPPTTTAVPVAIVIGPTSILLGTPSVTLGAGADFATTSVAGVTRLSSAPTTPTIPIAVGTNGGTMTGLLILSGDPVAALGAVTKQYVDSMAGGELHDPGSNGVVVRTALGVTTARTMTGTAGDIVVTNGNGVSGNPTFDLINTTVTPASYGDATDVATFTVDSKGRLTAAGTTPIALTGTGITISGTTGDVVTLDASGHPVDGGTLLSALAVAASVVANDGGAPSAREDIFANIGTAVGLSGQLFVATDTKVLYRSNGATWDVISASTPPALSNITAATANQTICNADWLQEWDWTLTGATDSGFTFGECGQSSGGSGAQNIVKIKTGIGSSANPLYVASNGNTFFGNIVVTSIGDVTVRGNDSYVGGPGSQVSLQTGFGQAGTSTGGTLYLQTGGGRSGGNIQIQTGNGDTTTGGNFNVTLGSGTTTGGGISLTSGDGYAGDGGSLTLTAGGGSGPTSGTLSAAFVATPAFIPATTLGIAAGLYSFTLTIDGVGPTNYNVTATGVDTMTSMAVLMATAIGGGVTVTAAGNYWLVTSSTTGVTSMIVVTHPTTGVNPDLFDAVDTAKTATVTFTEVDGSAGLGGRINLTSGSSAGVGGPINIIGGVGTPNGGTINITAGTGTSNSGNINISTPSSGGSGYIDITTGNSTSFGGNYLSLTSGDGTNGGQLNITSGNGTVGIGGQLTITAGSGTTNGGHIIMTAGPGNTNGGTFIINTGSGVAGTGGNFTVNTGTGSGAAGGNIVLNARSGTPNGQIDLQINGVTNFFIDPLGSVVAVGGGPLTNPATDGYLYIPTIDVTPTGVPTSHTGTVPVVVEDHPGTEKLWIYSSSASIGWGAVSTTVYTKTFPADNNYVTVDGDIILGDATAGVLTIKLSATPRANMKIIVKKTDVSANAVTVSGNGHNIDGAAFFNLPAQYDSVTVVSDGTDWFVI